MGPDGQGRILSSARAVRQPNRGRKRLPYATNPVDGVRTYFEDSGGAGAPVLFYTGFADPLEVAKSSRLARALSGEFRLAFADHRGQGGSDKAREPSAYALARRVADAVAVLDALRIERAHFLGSSWGARLGFALGEHAPDRALSLVLCGNQPYEWELESPTAHAVAAAIAASRHEGMKGFVETVEATLGFHYPEPDRTWTLEKNDPAALEAAWRSAQVEGPVSQDLSAWRLPCLICAGESDEMHDAAERAAAEIPGARFVSLAGHSHISAFYEADDLLLPHILELLRSAPPKHEVAGSGERGARSPRRPPPRCGGS
jgi:pimeloyl-ACP methyl ester carboxylesterase